MYRIIIIITAKIEITDLNNFLAAENTSVLIILATTVYLWSQVVTSSQQPVTGHGKVLFMYYLIFHVYK